MSVKHHNKQFLTYNSSFGDILPTTDLLVSTTALDLSSSLIYYWTGTEWIELDPVGGVGGGELDRDITPTITVGGIDKTMDFYIGDPLGMLWETLLSPYQPSSLSSLVISPSGSLEVGESITVVSAKLTWKDNSADVSPISAIISGQGFDVGVTLVSSPQTELATSVTFSYDIPTTETWIFTAKDPDGTNLSEVKSYVRWYNSIRHGNDAAETITASEIGAFTSTLRTGFAEVYHFPVGDKKYKWFCVASSEAQPTKFSDDDTKLTVPFEDPITVNVTNTSLLVVPYKCYRSTYQLGGAMNIKIA